MSKKKPWTAAELEVLRKAEGFDMKRLKELLPNRSREAIRYRWLVEREAASYKTGKWSAEDTEYLKAHYKEMSLSALSVALGRSVPGVQAKMQHEGLSKKQVSAAEAQKRTKAKKKAVETFTPNTKDCPGCYYWDTTCSCCLYMILTDEKRPCKGGECKEKGVWKPVSEKRKLPPFLHR